MDNNLLAALAKLHHNISLYVNCVAITIGLVWYIGLVSRNQQNLELSSACRLNTLAGIKDKKASAKKQRPCTTIDLKEKRKIRQKITIYKLLLLTPLNLSFYSAISFNLFSGSALTLILAGLAAISINSPGLNGFGTPFFALRAGFLTVLIFSRPGNVNSPHAFF